MSVNEVRLIGNIGNDPEVRFLPSGSAVANFTVATSEKWKDKQSGQMQEKTEWHRCTAFDRGNYEMGKYIGESCRKGTKIYIEGSLETREWEKDGIKRYTTEIKVSSFEVLANGVQRDQQGQAPQQPAQGTGFNQPPAQAAPQAVPTSFGAFAPPPPTWETVSPTGEAKTQGATIDQIKAHPDVVGDVNKAISLGFVANVPF